MFLPIQLPPGIYRNGTEYQATGRWYDCNLVRWYEGVMRPMGGWEELDDLTEAVSTTEDVIVRGMVAWRDNLAGRNLAMGSQNYLQLYNGSNTLNITPSGLLDGRTDSVLSAGYGVGPYGAEEYGTPRTIEEGASVVTEATTWSLDTFGETLMAVSSADRRLYYWTPNSGQATAALVTTAPDLVRGVVVTNERFVMLYGAEDNPRLVQWSSQEDYTVWTPDATNSAGDILLQTQGVARAGRNFRGQVLIWTEIDLHLLNYVGPPFYYGTEKAGTGCGIAGPNAVAITDTIAVWMGDNAFFIFDGFVKPLPCDVSDYVFSDINSDQRVKVFAVNEPYFGEVTWYYPSSEATENDRFARWNYRENHWAIGSLARSAQVERGVFQNPIATDNTGAMYEMETGSAYGGATPYAESGPVELGNGDRVMFVRQMVPDERTSGDVQVTFYSRFYPNQAESTHGPYSLSPLTDVRFTGRQVKMRFAGANDWRVGRFRLDAVQAGGR